MKELKRTTESVSNASQDLTQLSDEALASVEPDIKPHYHIVYCDHDAGVAQCAPAADGHTHEIQYTPAQPPIPEQPPGQDPNTGQPIPPQPGQPGQPSQITVMPSEDGHMHDGLIAYVPEQSKSKDKDDKVVSDVLTLFKTAMELERESRRDAIRAEDFVWGEQWDVSLKNKLEGENRACLTINKTGKYINQLCGHQRMNRMSLGVLPTEDGDESIAEVLNVVMSHDFEQCNYPREESLVFKDQVTMGRGSVNVKMDFTNDLQGKFVAERMEWDHVVYGSHRKHDLEDCEYQVKHKLFSIAKIRQLWPKFAKELETAKEVVDSVAGLDAEEQSEVRDMHVTFPDSQYAHSDNKYPVTVDGVTMVDVAKKEYRVLECWRRQYRKVFVAANPKAELFINLHGWKREDAESVAYLQGFQLVETTMPQMRITTICSGLLLSDSDPADLELADFHTVPVYGEKRKDRFKGLVHDAMDVQRELNKRRSQTIDICNRMASYNYYVTPDTFIDETELERFKRESSTAGAVFTVTDEDRPPRASEGIKFPSEVAALQQQSDVDLREMIDVTVEPTGSREAAQSLAQRQKMSLMGKEEYFDNLAFANRQVGRIWLSFVQRYYSPQRILKIFGQRAAKEQVEINGQPYDPAIHLQELEQKLKDADLTKYDVSIGESAYSPTMKMSTSATIQEIAARGGPVPPQMLIDSLDVPETKKRKMMKMFEQSQEAEAQTASNSRNMEIEKTLIAQGMIPPKVAQEFGVGQAVPQQGQQPQQGAQPQPPMPNAQANGQII